MNRIYEKGGRVLSMNRIYEKSGRVSRKHTEMLWAFRIYVIFKYSWKYGPILFLDLSVKGDCDRQKWPTQNLESSCLCYRRKPLRFWLFEPGLYTTLFKQGLRLWRFARLTKPGVGVCRRSCHTTSPASLCITLADATQQTFHVISVNEFMLWRTDQVWSWSTQRWTTR